MAALTHGMDLAQVEEMGRFLRARADDLDHLVSALDSKVRSTTWQGPDADRFRNQWWPKHRTRLQATAEHVRGLGQAALSNATDQQRASEAEAGGGFSTGFPGSSTPGMFPREQLMEWLIDNAKDGDTLLSMIDVAEIARHAKTWKAFRLGLEMAGNGVDVWGFGAAISAMEFTVGWQQDGLWDAGTLQAAFDGGGGVAASIVAGPAGGLAWTVGTGIGGFVGTHMDDWSTDQWERSVGSDEGVANSMWFQRNYGVFDPDDLPQSVRWEAIDRLNEHRMGRAGIWNMAVIDPIENVWWAADQTRKLFR